MHMSTRRVGIIVGLVIIALGILLFAVRTGKESSPTTSETASTSLSVTLSRTYKKGVYAFKGSFTVPTPCHSVSATAAIASSPPGSPQTIHIDVSAPPDDGRCLQRVTEKTFSVSIAASKDAVTEVSVNGVAATIAP
jgi:hypothetical protein